MSSLPKKNPVIKKHYFLLDTTQGVSKDFIRDVLPQYMLHDCNMKVCNDMYVIVNALLHMCMEKTARGGVSRDLYSTRRSRVLHDSRDSHPAFQTKHLMHVQVKMA